MHSELDLEEQLFKIAQETTNDKNRSKDFSKKVSNLLDIYESPKDFNKTLLEELQNKDYRNAVLLSTISNNFPNHGLQVTKKQSSLNLVGNHSY